MPVVTVSAKTDKTTKTKKRFIIEPNEEGISGTIYLDKDDSKTVDEILIKIKM